MTPGPDTCVVTDWTERSPDSIGCGFMGKKHDEVKNCDFSKNSQDLHSKEFTYPKLRLVAVDGISLEEGSKKSKKSKTRKKSS